MVILKHFFCLLHVQPSTQPSSLGLVKLTGEEIPISFSCSCYFFLKIFKINCLNLQTIHERAPPSFVLNQHHTSTFLHQGSGTSTRANLSFFFSSEKKKDLSVWSKQALLEPIEDLLFEVSFTDTLNEGLTDKARENGI